MKASRFVGSERRRALAVLALLGCGGCMPESGGSPRAESDGAAPRIVRHVGAPVDTAHADEVIFALHAAGPEYEFFQIRGVEPLADGTIAVSNGASQEVRFYSPEGLYLGAAGGSGSGPEEFSSVGAIFRMTEDTIAVHDARLRRLSFVVGQTIVGVASYADRLGVAPRTSSGCLTEPGLAGVMRGGALVLRGWQCVDAAGTNGIRDSNAELIVLRHEAEEALVVPSALRASVYERHDAGPQIFWPLPLGDPASVRVSSDRVYLTPGDAYVIRVYDRQMTPVLEIRDDWRRVPVDAGVRERREAGMSASSRTLFDGIPYPDSLPAYTGLVVGDDRIWASHATVSSTEDRHWTVYDGDGHRLGVVVFPAGFDLLAVAADGRAYGVGRDELGVERVEVRRAPSFPR